MVTTIVWTLPRVAKSRYKGAFPLYFEQNLVQLLGYPERILHPFGGMAETGLRVDLDPTVLKLAFSGGLELERSNASDVELYNSLRAGKSATLSVEVHVAGAKTSHRRDSEGDVDAVVQTKSLIVHSIDLTDEEILQP